MFFCAICYTYRHDYECVNWSDYPPDRCRTCSDISHRSCCYGHRCCYGDEPLVKAKTLAGEIYSYPIHTVGEFIDSYHRQTGIPSHCIAILPPLEDSSSFPFHWFEDEYLFIDGFPFLSEIMDAYEKMEPDLLYNILIKDRDPCCVGCGEEHPLPVYTPYRREKDGVWIHDPYHLYDLHQSLMNEMLETEQIVEIVPSEDSWRTDEAQCEGESLNIPIGTTYFVGYNTDHRFWDRMTSLAAECFLRKEVDGWSRHLTLRLDDGPNYVDTHCPILLYDMPSPDYLSYENRFPREYDYIQ